MLADNDVALKAQAAAGFKREGYLRQHVKKDGVRCDVVLLVFSQTNGARGATRCSSRSPWPA